MPHHTALSRRLVVLCVGTGLWAFLQLSHHALGLIPAFAVATREWGGIAAPGTRTVLDFAIAIALAGALLLAHRMERAPNVRRAIHVALLMAFAPAVAIVALGDRDGQLAFAAARAGIMIVAVVGASLLIFAAGVRRRVGGEAR